ncbi:MAG TPA: SpoIIE family protein phosphatase, partial [Gaiellaceae bacterium]|nr:SpoIIE family protein phosphatase [Gaiellaceae bacterium]
AGLRAAGGIVEPSGEVFNDSFAAYGRGMLDQSGISTIGLAQVVTRTERARFESRAKHSILDLQTTGRFVRAPPRDVYYPVTAVQPDTVQTRAGLGFDLNFDRVRGPAARRARDLGEPQLTAPLEFGRTGEPGLLIVGPLYRLGASLDTIRQRRRALVGFVSAAYSLENIGLVALAGLPEGTEVSVMDDGQPVVGNGSLAGAVTNRLPIGGRLWTIDVKRPDRSPFLLAALVLAGGIALAAVIWGLFAQARRRERALEDAREEERAARREAVDAQRRTAALQLLTAGLSRCRTRREVMTLAVERAGTTFSPLYALAALVDRARGVLRPTDLVGGEGQLTEGAMVPLDAPLAVCAAARAGEPIWLDSEDAWQLAVPAEPALPPGVRSGTCLPLVGTSEVGGVLALGSAEPRWSEADRSLAEAMARQVGLALERAHLEEQEHELVATLQRTLLPEELPPVDGLDLAGWYEPAAAGLDIGGDWYDAVELSDGRLALAVGDVVGHGASAAAVMGQLRSALRAFVLERADAAAALRSLAQFASDPTHATGATAVCVVLDPATGVFQYARAGHPPVLVVRADGRPDVLDEARGIPLGVFADAAYENSVGVLGEGDLLVLYSDGAVERRGEAIDEGIERLAALVARNGLSSRELCDVVSDALRAEETVTDDVALVLARRVARARS